VELFSLYSNSHVNDLDRGAYFGEISFFSGQPRAASARAVDFTSVYYIERNEFLNFIQKFPLEKVSFDGRKPILKRNLGKILYN